MDKPTQKDVMRLLERCGGRDSGERERAVDELWDIAANHPRVQRLCMIEIRAATGDPCDLVRNTAVEALGEVGNRNDLRRLRIALADEEWLVRASAAESYARVAGKRGLTLLGKVMREDPNEVVRGYAAGGIGDIGEPSGIAPLLGQIGAEREPRTLVGIHFALVLLGNAEHVAPLARLLHDKEWHAVCDATMNCLGELVDRSLVVEPFATEVKRELRTFAAGPGVIEWRRAKALDLAAKLG